MMHIITSAAIEFSLRVPQMTVAELDERCLPAIARYRLLVLEEASELAVAWMEGTLPCEIEDGHDLRFAITGGQT